MTQFPSGVNLRALLSNNDTEAIRRVCHGAHPHAVAEQLAELSDSEAWAVLLRLESPQDGHIFAHLPRERQIALATSHNVREVAALLEHVEADDRTDLIQQLEDDRADRVLQLLSREEREQTERLRAYDPDTVGAEMNVDVVLLEPQMTAEQALARLREQAPRKETIYQAFVVDERGRLTGRISLADLVIAAPHVRLTDLMESEPVRVEANAPRTKAARIIQDYDLVVLPVVEGDDRLVGIVTVDDVIDVVEEEVSDTMYQKAGVGDLIHQRDHVFSEKLTRGNILYPIRMRILFLLVALAGGFAVGGLIEYWEDMLVVVAGAMVFIPVIMDMGGNTGTQSTTIFARGLALGHIDLKRFLPYFLREGSVGLVMGVILGLIGGTVAYVWQGLPNDNPQLGLAVGISLFAVVTFAALLGFLLPYVMVKMGLDHAPGADPFITTIKDFTGLGLYFLLVQWMVPATAILEDEHAAAMLESVPAAIGVMCG